MRRPASPRLVVQRVPARPIAFGPEGFITMWGTSAIRSKRQPKGVKYAKHADVGDWVHAKGINVTSETNLKRWYGSIAMSKYFSGISIGVTTTLNRDEGGTVDLPAFVYCDRNRQYFIASCSNISLGRQIQRTRVQQLTDVDTNDDPVRVDMALDCPKVASTYYSTCGKIDQHNRCRQDTLNLEKKIQTNHWHKCVNMSIFGMIVVDSWMLYKGCTGGNQLNQNAYYKALIDALIDEPLKTCQKRVGPACLQDRRVHHCQRRLVRLDWECA
jgi:hypothetical protein